MPPPKERRISRFIDIWLNRESRPSVEMSDNGTSLSQRKATEMLQAVEVMSVSKYRYSEMWFKTTSVISECNRVTDAAIFNRKCTLELLL